MELVGEVAFIAGIDGRGISGPGLCHFADHRAHGFGFLRLASGGGGQHMGGLELAITHGVVGEIAQAHRTPTR